MDNQYLKDILKSYAKKRDQAESELEYRKSQIYKNIPEIMEIDDELAQTGINISKAILTDPVNADNLLKELKERTNGLTQKKAFILTENNIPLSFLELQYDCTKCKDTGFDKRGGKCSCLKQEIIKRAYSVSNLDNILGEENFNKFDISLFSNESFNDFPLSPRENMLDILSITESYVSEFSRNNDSNLMFFGKTGLGKTYLCNCIAKSLLDKGHIVVYQTAFKLLEIIENYKFKNGDHELYRLIFDCDLLIIDDLGTEFTNSFTNIELFNIINTRMLNKKSIVISTNLSPNEMAKVYGDRIISRVVANFELIRFYGGDLRWNS